MPIILRKEVCLDNLLIGCEMIDEACNKLDLTNDENKDKILLLKHLLDISSRQAGVRSNYSSTAAGGYHS